MPTLTKVHENWTARPRLAAPPDSSPIIPRQEVLPDCGDHHASLLFFGRPHVSYGYSSLNGTHTLRFDAKGKSVTIAITDPYQAHQLLVDLELAASALRRRLDLPSEPSPSSR